MKSLASILFAASLLLSLPLPALSAAPDYSRYTLTLSGKLINLVTEDMDGDGLQDILAVSLVDGNARTPQRRVDVFHQKKGRGYAGKPDMNWNASASAAAFDVGDVTGTGVMSFCFLAPDGLYAYLPSGPGYSARPSRLIAAPGIFSRPDPLDMPYWPFMVKDASARAYIALVPGTNSLGVYTKSGAGYASAASLRFPVSSTFSGGPRVGSDASLTISHRLPVVTAAGYNSRTGSDVVMTWDDSALIYLRGRDGGYRGAPDVTFMPGLFKPSDKSPLEGAWVDPVDMDGDGRLDLVVTKKTGGMAHTKSLVFIYIRRPDGALPAKPGDTIITEGVVGPRFLDIDGDGRLDVLLPSMKVGIGNFVNVLTSGQVNVDVDIYIQAKNGSFPDKPTASKVIGFKLDLSNLLKASPVLEAGRFTKGKGFGLAVVSKDNLVSIYTPDKYSLLSDRPGLELKVEGPTEMDVSDLNGDGVDDIVMSYKKSDKSAATVNVFLSK